MPLKEAVLHGLSLLVAVSPCALAISTPAAVLSAVARAARGGVLMKGGEHLESLGKVNVMAFDKTGTLTEGRPRLIAVTPVDGCDEARLLGTAAAVEMLSNHPLAKSVVNGAKDRGISTEVAVGSQGLFEGIALPTAIAAEIDRLESAGQTTIVVRRAEQFLGVLGVADQVRPAAAAALASLKAMGVRRTMMLSGDNIRVAKSIAAAVGIEDARAPLMPDGKVKALRELGKAEVVAMAANRVIRQNLVISLGWTPIGQAVVLDEGSTLVVVLNGLRLSLLED